MVICIVILSSRYHSMFVFLYKYSAFNVHSSPMEEEQCNPLKTTFSETHLHPPQIMVSINDDHAKNHLPSSSSNPIHFSPTGFALFFYFFPLFFEFLLIFLFSVCVVGISCSCMKLQREEIS